MACGCSGQLKPARTSSNPLKPKPCIRYAMARDQPLSCDECDSAGRQVHALGHFRAQSATLCPRTLMMQVRTSTPAALPNHTQLCRGPRLVTWSVVK